jgi:type IV pilus assembly protein PilC
MKIKYEALTRSGETYSTVGEFGSKAELFNFIKDRGDSLLSSEEVKRTGLLKKLDSINIGGVKAEQKILFARNLGAMLEAGLPLSRALDVIYKQAKKGKFKNVVASIREEISIGTSFSESLKKHQKVFSPLFIAMVSAGEESGSLTQTLAQIADQMEGSYKLKKKVKGAMMYPGIIVSAMILIGILMMIYVVPTLTQVFKDMEVDLPASTKLVILISDTLKNNAILTFIMIGVVVGAFIWLIKTPWGNRGFTWIVMRLPVVGFIVREVNVARIATTFGSLLGSGVEITRSLEITKDVVQNPHYREVIIEAGEQVQKGSPISGVFENYEFLFPPLFTEMAAVGEETGKVSELFSRVGKFFSDDVEQKTKNISTIIEPVLMVVIGGAVGFFAISMLTPMYSLTSSI